jgi:hypothetical protein
MINISAILFIFFFFAAPIGQIILSILNIKGRIFWSLRRIVFLSALAEICFSIILIKMDEIQILSLVKAGNHCMDCGLIGIFILTLGLCKMLLVIPIIFFIFKSIQKNKHRRSTEFLSS